MHVLHVLNGLTGGAAESTLEIINELNANDIESSIYVFGRNSSVIPNKIEAAVGGRVFRGPLYLWVSHRGGIFSKVASEIFYLAYSIFLSRSSGSIKKVAKSVNASLISSCTSVSPDGALAALRAGIPHVWHIRELYGEGKMFSAKTLWRRNFRKSILSTGMVVCNSPFTRDSLFLFDDKVVVVFNKIDLNGLGRLRGKYPHEASRCVSFGVIASGAKWKRHDVAIEAAGMLKKDYSNFKINFIGFELESLPLEYRNSLIQKIEHHKLEDNVEFLGKLESSVEAFSRIDVLVHAATAESYGRVYYEAAASGRPIIACRSLAADRVVLNGKNGYLVDPNDTREMVERMKVFLSFEKIMEFGISGATMMDDGFKVAKNDSVVDLYMSHAANPTRPRGLISAFQQLMFPQ